VGFDCNCKVSFLQPSTSSGVARHLAARCGCQICCPSVFGDIGEPIQPYCLHFLEFHYALVFKCKKNKHLQRRKGCRFVKTLRL